MKKILTRIMALCLAFSLIGCSTHTNKDDIQTVFDAFDQTLNAESGKLSGDVKYSTGEEQTIHYTIEFIQKGNLQIKANLGLEANGNKIDDYLSFYIKDGKTYLKNMDTTSQSVATNIGIDVKKPLSIYNPFLDLTTDQLSALFKSTEKKDNTYTFTIDSSQLATLLDGMGALNISKATIQATVEKDHLSNLEMKINGQQTFDDKTTPIDIDLTCQLDQYNELDALEFPSDLETY